MSSDVVARRRAEQLRREILGLSQEIQATSLRLAALLKELRDKNLFRLLGYESLQEFVEKELGFRARKMRALLEILEGFERAGVSHEEAATVQPSKAVVIASILTEANRDDWLAKARALPVVELRREVAKAQGRPLTDGPLKSWGVALFDEQRQTVETAMRLAGLAAWTDIRGIMLVTICQEFIGAYSHLDGSEG